MSRSGYTDEDENNTFGLWRGAVASAIRGKRGQSMLRELASALDDLPEKRLASESLVNEDGEFCTLGALGRKRGLDMTKIDPDDRDEVAKAFGVADALAAEIMYMNDEYFCDYEWVKVEICGPVRPNYPEYGSHIVDRRVLKSNVNEKRWIFMREWVSKNLKLVAV